MTTSTTPPLLTPLPPAPLPTDAEAVFDAKAGASLTAQAVMVGEVNTALAWQADSMATSLDYKTQAANSATAAAGSASSASGSAEAAAKNGAAQVELATNQANNAAVSANSAQIAAVAAGAAAGLPSFIGKDAFDILRINASKNAVEWGKSGQSVGDILVTARAPGSTYVETNRATYLQSAYPDLYALIGPILDTDRSVVASASVNSSFPADSISGFYGIADSGTLMIALTTNVAFCYTSIDNGVVWVRRPTPFSNGYQIRYLNGVFVASLSQNGQSFYTTTDGVSWVIRNQIAQVSYPNVRTVGELFLFYSQGSLTYYTSPDGVVWTTRSNFPNASFQLITNVGSYLCGFLSSTSIFYYTSDGFTWWNASVNPVAGAWYPATILYKNGMYFSVSQNAADTGFYKSPSLTGPWSRTPSVFVNADGSTSGFIGGASSIGNECLVFVATGNNIWISNDLGFTWSNRSIASFSQFVFGLAGRFLWSNGNLICNLPYRSYDPSTSFITPKVLAQITPLVTYIKGKLA